MTDQKPAGSNEVVAGWAFTRCPRCGRTVPSERPECAVCFHDPLAPPPLVRSSLLPALALGVAALVGGIVLLLLRGQPQSGRPLLEWLKSRDGVRLLAILLFVGIQLIVSLAARRRQGRPSADDDEAIS